MSMRERLVAALPSGIETHFPTSNQHAQEILNRWSDTGIEAPFAIVVPTKNADVVAAVKFAASEGQQIVCGGGGRGCYVPVGSQILYLDLKRFNSIQIDQEQGTVSVGGGATAGEVSKACAAQGRYTRKYPESDPFAMFIDHSQYSPSLAQLGWLEQFWVGLEVL